MKKESNTRQIPLYVIHCDPMHIQKYNPISQGYIFLIDSDLSKRFIVYYKPSSE